MAVDQSLSLESSHSADTDHDPHAATGVISRKLGMWVFLISEIFFFSGLIGGSVLLRVQDANWPAPGEVLNVPLTSLNTFILLVSSVAVVKALASLQDNKLKQFKGYLVLTVLLGTMFLGIQVIEYVELYNHGLTFTTYRINKDDTHALEGVQTVASTAAAVVEGESHGELVHSVYGTTFYIQTGFHGAHVTGGVIWLIVVTIKAFRGSYSPTNYHGVEIFGLYWHFVDLVWILLFTIVYLI